MSQPILVAVDIEHKETALTALQEGAFLASAKGVALHVAYVLPYGFYSYIGSYLSQDILDDSVIRAKDELAKIATAVEVTFGDLETHVLRGGVYQQILLLAETLHAQTIVVNAHYDLETNIMGPVTAQVARYANCKVLIVR